MNGGRKFDDLISLSSMQRVGIAPVQPGPRELAASRLQVLTRRPSRQRSKGKASALADQGLEAGEMQRYNSEAAMEALLVCLLTRQHLVLDASRLQPDEQAEVGADLADVLFILAHVGSVCIECSSDTTPEQLLSVLAGVGGGSGDGAGLSASAGDGSASVSGASAHRSHDVGGGIAASDDDLPRFHRQASQRHSMLHHRSVSQRAGRIPRRPARHVARGGSGSQATAPPQVLIAQNLDMAPPRVQSALAELMIVRSISYGMTTVALPSTFFIIATTCRTDAMQIPERIRDRFLAFHALTLPLPSTADVSLSPIYDRNDLESLQADLDNVFVEQGIRQYIRDIVIALRNHDSVASGVGPRATMALERMSRMVAMLKSRLFVTPLDVRRAAPIVLSHRLTLWHEATGDGKDDDNSVASFVSRVVMTLRPPV